MRINQPIWIIGFMSGTSADAVDAALLQTDGETITAHGGGVSVPYEATLGEKIHAAMRGKRDVWEEVAHEVSLAHIQAAERLLVQGNVPRETVKLLGFHGQTVHHAPDKGETVQLGDAALLAKTLGIPVVADFRKNDVALGGEGAPLAPLYHAALADEAGLELPVAFLNLGGVANVTLVASRPSSLASETLSDSHLFAFDCGPANALMDDVLRTRTGKMFDENGALAAKGKVDEAVLASYLAHPFFARPIPKSLDRNAFSLEAVARLCTEDALATLAAFTVQAVAKAMAQLPGKKPQQMLVTGGGRRNAHLMRLLAEGLDMPVKPVEDSGFDGDLLEAEAFAYLAARSVRGLPLSLPTTTGIRQAASGGVFYPV